MAKPLPALIALLLTAACLPAANPSTPHDRGGERQITPSVIHTDRGVHYRDESGRWQAIGKPHGEGYSGGIDAEDAQ